MTYPQGLMCHPRYYSGLPFIFSGCDLGIPYGFRNLIGHHPGPPKDKKSRTDKQRS